MEVAGMVSAVGKGAKGIKKGEMVAAFLPAGGVGEFAKTGADLAVALPQGVAPAVAAALPHSFAATLIALRDRAGLAEGETLLVLGAGGPAGLAAIEIGKQLGARVIAAANGRERLDAAREQGADEVIDAGNVVIAEEAMKLTGDKRVQVIFDPVNGEAAIASFPAGAMGMRYVMAGFAGGQVPRLDPTQLFVRDVTLIAANSHRLIERNPQGARKALADVLAWVADGKLRPRIAAKFPLKDARAAFDYVKARRGLGAVLVTMGG
jgi:NADPH2:quinone reductase